MGSGFKDWAAGDVLTAADVDGYLMRQTVMTFADSSARDTALSGVLDEGMVAYLEDDDVFTVYDGSSWFQYGPGKILQVVSTTKTDTFSASIAGTSSTAITGLTATITPSSSSSKVLVLVSTNSSVDDGGGFSKPYVALALTRGATEISLGDASGVRTRLTAFTHVGEESPNSNATTAFNFLDSPATTSATTYGVNLHNITASSITYYVNRSYWDSNSTTFPRYTSTITLMEVSA